MASKVYNLTVLPPRQTLLNVIALAAFLNAYGTRITKQMIQVRLVPPFSGAKMRTEIFFPYIEKIGNYYAVNTFDASTWLAHRELKYCLHRHIKNYCVRLVLRPNGSCVIMTHNLYLLKLKFAGIWSGSYVHIKAKHS